MYFLTNKTRLLRRFFVFYSATLFAKSKNPMLAHLYADVIEEEGGGKAGAKKQGGSMQTISATHRVSHCLCFYVNKTTFQSNRNH